ncbi:MAG: FAD-dependent oxidoreductase [Rhodobacteraceae bacterium]|nr:FAD-dependent oxidoreductase [Paracoccaceae bacterium]
MPRILVIGGGVVGISCALGLLEDGHDVTVLDPGPIGAGASAASCGCIAVGEIIPLSQPGIMRKVPGWLLNPEGPLAIRPGTALQMLPWLLKFVRNATPGRMRAISADLAGLTFAAAEDFRAQITRHGIRDMLIERPIIKVFDSSADKARMANAFALAREMGCIIDEISGGEAREMEPALAPDFPHAAILRDWTHIADCVRLVADLTQVFRAGGGRFIAQAGVGFEREGKTVTAVKMQNGQTVAANEVVLAAGSHTKLLARELGIRLPLEGLMGYWTGLPDPGVQLKHAVFSVSGGFGITPYENQLGVAGTVEFAAHDAAPDWHRADVLMERARRVLPGLQTEGAHRRLGRRPFMPDTRPVIGRSRRIANVTFATGHGQLGVTLGATTARLVTNIVAGRKQNNDISAFSPDRFG